MGNSTFLAQLIGPFALALGFGVLVNRAKMRAVLDEFIRNRAVMFLAGIVTFPAGLAIVLTHNVWVRDWPLLITILGWLTAISGAFRLIAPDLAIRYGRRAYERHNGLLSAGLFWLALGLVFCFFGYIA